VRWRRAILDKANELDWCVHELEEVVLDELEYAKIHEIEDKFKQMGVQDDGSSLSCSVCQPPPPTGY
jgi:hypothetical protein